MSLNRRGGFTYQGTELRQTASGDGNRVRRRCFYVSKSGGATDGLPLVAEAKDQFIAEEGFYNDGIADLPLVSIEGRQVARNIVEINADYAGISEGLSGPSGGTELATFDVVKMPRKVWTSSNATYSNGVLEPGTYKQGLPFGRMITGQPLTTQFTAEEIASLPSDVVTHTLVRIKVRRQSFGVNPILTLPGDISTTGGGTIAGFNCPRGSLLLEGVVSSASTVAGVSDPSGQTPAELLIYDYTVQFLFDPNGFPNQYFNASGEVKIGLDYLFGDWTFS